MKIIKTRDANGIIYARLFCFHLLSLSYSREALTACVCMCVCMHSKAYEMCRKFLMMIFFLRISVFHLYKYFRFVCVCNTFFCSLHFTLVKSTLNDHITSLYYAFSLRQMRKNGTVKILNKESTTY